MKSLSLATLAVCACASVAAATPRETFDAVAGNGGAFINSNARINDPTNVVLTHTFTGGYIARFLSITGTINGSVGASWQAEASILATPPGGATPFIIQPYTVNGAYTVPTATPAGAYTVPVGAVNAAGLWTFQFFDRYDDAIGAADGHWEACAITLDDGAAPAVTPLSGPGATFNNVSVTGIAAAPGFSQTFTLPSGAEAAVVRVRLQATGVLCDPAVNNTTTPTQAVVVRVTPPGGTALIIQPGALASSSIASGQTALATPINPVGTWTVEAYNTVATYANNLSTLVVELGVAQPPTVFDDIGVVHGNIDGSEAVITQSEQMEGTGTIKWIKFRCAADVTGGGTNYLDIDTETTAGIDTEIGVYSSTGALMGVSDDEGSGLLSLLTYGNTASPRTAPVVGGNPYNGINGDLLTGDYYLATGVFNVVYGPTFVVTSTGTSTGVINVNFRTNLPGATSPCGLADVGSQGGNPGADSHLDNNDFVVYITLFFNNSPQADVGSQGGAAGADNAWDNNDFIVYINLFFNAPASCFN